MNKFYILALSPLLLLNTSIASTFYIGLNANHSHLSDKTTANSTVHDSVNGDVNTVYTFNQSSKRIHPSFVIGDHYIYKNAVLGLEYSYIAPVNLSSCYVHKNGFSHTYAVTAKQGHSLGLKMGYFVTPNSLAFLKLIGEKRDIKHTLNRTEADPAIQNYDKSTSYRPIGRGFSIGVEHHYGKNWVLNLEYKTVSYASKNLQYDTPLSANLTEVQKIHSRKNINTLMMGVIYRF